MLKVRKIADLLFIPLFPELDIGLEQGLSHIVFQVIRHFSVSVVEVFLQVRERFVDVGLFCGFREVVAE